MCLCVLAASAGPWMQLHWKQIHTAGPLGGGFRPCPALAASLNAPVTGLGDPGGDENKRSQHKWTLGAVLVGTAECWLNSGCVVGSECSPVPEGDEG